MILRSEKKYFFDLNYHTLLLYHSESISVLMPQMILSNRLEKKAIRFYKIVTTFKYKGFFDSTFFIIDEIWSINFRNLKIFLVFFIVALNFKATLAATFSPFLNSSTTFGI